MQRVQTARNWASGIIGYTLIVAVFLGVFLLAVGLNTDSLPFPRNDDFSDAVTSHWPNALVLYRAAHSEGTLSNPFVMNDQPWLPNPLSKVFYPPQWAAFFLPPIVHLNLMLWLHLTLAGVAMRWFLRGLGLSAGIASLMGVAYAFTPRLMAAAGAGHLDVIYACAWLPVVLGMIRYQGSGVRHQVIHSGLSGAALTMAFLADVRIFVLIFGLAAAYWAYLRVSSRTLNARSLAYFTLSCGVAALLSAPQWVTLLAQLGKLSRVGLTVEGAGVFSLNPVMLIGLWVGDQGGGHETMVYLGASVFALALLGGVSWGWETLFWVIAALVAGAYALGSNFILWTLLVRIVPGLSWLRVPARAWIIGVFALIVLAGYGLRALQSDGAALKRTTPRLIAVFGVIGLTCAFVFFAVDKGSAATGVIVIILTCALLRSNRRPSLALWTLLIVADLTLMNTTLVEGVRRADWLDWYQPIADSLQADQVDHVYSPSYSFPQQAATYYKIPIIGGIDPFQYADYVRQIEAATGVRASGYSVTLPAFEGELETVNRNAILDPEKLAALGVSHIVAAFPINDPALTLYRRLNDLYLYRNTRYVANR